MARKRIPIKRAKRLEVIAENGSAQLVGLRPDERIARDGNLSIIEEKSFMAARKKVVALRTLNPGVKIWARSVVVETRPIYIPTS